MKQGPALKRGEGSRLIRKEAENMAETAGREKNFLAETWFCGIINQKIRDAADRGQFETKVRFSARSYVSKHQQRFIEIYEAEGYNIFFRPNYLQIEPSMYDMIIRWDPEEKKKLPDNQNG